MPLTSQLPKDLADKLVYGFLSLEEMKIITSLLFEPYPFGEQIEFPEVHFER